MPDLTRLAACSGEIVSPGICDPLPVGIRVRRRVYNENWRKEGSPFSLSLDVISLRPLIHVEFPVLQAVYPDRENRFPEESGFDPAFAQPLDATRISDGRTLRTISWASADPESSLFDWKFTDSPHTRVFLSKSVHEGENLFTYVSHDEEDGAWQFLGDSMSDGDSQSRLRWVRDPSA